MLPDKSSVVQEATVPLMASSDDDGRSPREITPSLTNEEFAKLFVDMVEYLERV